MKENGPENWHLIRHLSRENGTWIRGAENGRLAIEAALATEQSDQPFDVILMDMRMSIMDDPGRCPGCAGPSATGAPSRSPAGELLGMLLGRREDPGCSRALITVR